MRVHKSRGTLLLIHLVIWVVYASFNHLVNQINWGEVFILDTIGKYFIAAFIFYTNSLFILPYTFKSKRYISFSLLLITILFASFGIKEFLYRIIFSNWGYPDPPYTLQQSFIMNSWWWFQYTLFGFGYWFAKESVTKEREKAALEKEKLRAEYAYLKSQINPHFLYNVLNFFYAKSLGASELLERGILCLSQFMRYVINNNEDFLGRIPIEDEIEQINSLITLNQLRFDQKLCIDFKIDGNLSNVKIIPYILITLVENAFKHGDVSNSSQPLLIRLSYTKPQQITFFIKNKKEKTPDHSNGIGLENIKRRLQLMYGSNHNIKIVDEKEIFSVNLSIHDRIW